jgi:hypothetical protein
MCAGAPAALGRRWRATEDPSIGANHAAIFGAAAVESNGGLAGDGSALETDIGDALGSGVTKQRPARRLDGLARWLTVGTSSSPKKSASFVSLVLCFASNEQ